MRFAWLCLTAILLSATQAAAQKIEGDWQTSIEEQGAQHQILIHISNAGGELKGSFDVPDQFDFNNPLSSLSFQRGNVETRTSS